MTRRPETSRLSRRGFGVCAASGLAALFGFGRLAAGASANSETTLQPETSERSRAMDSKELVTYCGLYCGLCADRARIPQQAAALRDSMHKEGFDGWGMGYPDFPEFWRYLTNLTDPGRVCGGCRAGGGYPGCEVRKCAKGKNITACPLCDEYPCERFTGLAATYPTLIADGKRLKKIGIDKFVQEQEARGKTGFSYADIRVDTSKD